jgi:aspartyl-tRNA(Asn)/glutamyl-tRNA(Gln) amidotransferase subunit B
MLYDEATGRTFPTRAKELRADYRYFAEPDLPAVQLTEDFVAGVRAELGPAPATRVRELREGYAATAAEAELIAFTPGYYAFLAGAAAAYGGERRALVNWLVGDVTRELNARGQRLDECRLTPAAFAALLGLLDGGALNVPAAREVLAALMTEGGEPAAIIAARGLGQLSDAAALAALVREAFEHNPRAVADVRAGKDKARAALVGYVMKKTGGRANPAVVNDCIAELLKKG